MIRSTIRLRVPCAMLRFYCKFTFSDLRRLLGQVGHLNEKQKDQIIYCDVFNNVALDYGFSRYGGRKNYSKRDDII